MPAVSIAERPAVRVYGVGQRTLLQRIWRRKFCYLLMLPTFVLLVAFAYIPAASAIYHGFTQWDGFTAARWVGLANFREMLASNTFHAAFRNLAILLIWRVILVLTIPVFVAELIFRVSNERLAHYFRLAFVFPIVVPTTVTIMMWQFFYEPNVGLFNTILQAVGRGDLQQTWLNDQNLALPSLMFMGFPWVDGVAVLIFLAGLLAIPTTVLDAARVDGADGLRRLIHLDLPLIIPQLKLMAILTIITQLQAFGVQLLLTRGGPADATTVPALEMYYAALNYNRFGFASAVGAFLFVIIFVLTFVNTRFIRSTVEFEASE